MATIAENLQIIKDSTDAIKQAIVNKGGNISGDISTWADAINGISGSKIRFFSFGGGGQYAYEEGMTWEEWCNSNYSKMCLYADLMATGIISSDSSHVTVWTSAGGQGFLVNDGTTSKIAVDSKINTEVTNYIVYFEGMFPQ